MRALIVIGLAAILASPAAAQWRNMAIDGLEPTDLDAMGVAAQSLEGRAVGDEEKWNNLETGNSGSVRLLKEDTYQEMPCQYRGHIINIAKTQQSSKLVFRVCKTPEGVWKDAPPQQ